MTKKIPALTDYISASDAVQVLTAKLQRPVQPGYIHKLRKVRCVSINRTTKLYHREDIAGCMIVSKTSRYKSQVSP